MDTSARAEVKNAADPHQVKRAAVREKDAEKLRAARLLAVLKTPDGRAFVWDTLGDCKVYESIWHPSAAIHYNAGRQDVGHELLARVVALEGGRWYLEMQREAIARNAHTDSEREAMHVARADGQGGNDV